MPGKVREGRASDPPPGDSWQLWVPTWARPLPPGQWSPAFWVWFLFDRLGVFRSGGYSVFVVRRGRRTIHRSCVFPRFFRFPFMGEEDLQVGDVWTDPSARGEGLATAALGEICQRLGRAGRSLWYLVEEGNASSIRVAERVGFEWIGVGKKHARLGVLFFGFYSVERFVPPIRDNTGGVNER